MFLEAPLTKYSNKIFKTLTGLGNGERAESKLHRAGLPSAKTPPAAASAGTTLAALPRISQGSPWAAARMSLGGPLGCWDQRGFLCKRQEWGKAGSHVAEAGLELGKHTQVSR